MEAFMGTILMVGFNYAPRGWLFCSGQTVPIQQNSAMFALLGTMYGGNGTTTFGIPDLRGRVPVGSQGTGPGLPNVAQGEMSGSANTTILTANLPSHTHALQGSSTVGDVSSPSSAVLAASSTRGEKQYLSAVPNATLAATSIAATGGGIPINNMQPYLGINFVIAMEGIFPSRN